MYAANMLKRLTAGVASLLGGLLVLANGTGHSQMLQSVNFSSCADAAAQGFHNITRDSPAYSSQLDRDGDGIACESGSLGDADRSGAGMPLNVNLGPTAEMLVRGVTESHYSGVITAQVSGSYGPIWRAFLTFEWPLGKVRTMTRTVYTSSGDGKPLTKNYTQKAEFDQKGRLIRFDSVSEDKKDFVYNRHVRATYNASGQVIREDITELDPSDSESITYQYDRAGNLTARNWYYGKSLAHIDRYEKRPAGVIVRTFNPDGQVNGMEFIVLDKQKRVVQKQYGDEQEFTEFDSQNRVKKTTELQTEEKNGEVYGMRKVVKTYKNGLVQREDNYSAGTMAAKMDIDSVWRYEGIDKAGNYTKSLQYIESWKTGTLKLSLFQVIDQKVTYWP